MDKSPCIYDGECSYLWECNDFVCQHEPLWPPSFLVVLAMILLPILIGIGNVGGLGGGITKVPILMLMLNYSQQYATYQAYCIQFGACISNAVLLFGQRHPKRDRPLVDYNYSLIIVPICVLGTTLGIYANDFVPELFTNIIFSVFLISQSKY
ncbi:hypothetical protein PPERSA_02953 [Pseudocohnilembus persalinus]|uniref:Sulfite exporter TauE/SafE n=1 Tax=Pseudocohnilembus persalinus TaxID=266149 RepID=A0A0V0QAC2_PSEPJ|nr:hypothetical protein PPERSA_02953 [Pseudocohnilembus persalinus]|eukprot:KRW99121.1 hypothetical protein PPERSA_02953 [Pseudocohnilembus persalinus]